MWIKAGTAKRRADRAARAEAELSAEGMIMPAKKGQRPPDLRCFNQPQK
jgi:hypothetical protein